MNRPAKLRGPLFIIALVVYSVILVVHLRSEPTSPETDIESLSPHFQFLMFPRGEVRLFATRDLTQASTRTMLNRPVSASFAELQSGVIGVVMESGGRMFAARSDLAFLPVAGADQFESWKRAACPAGTRCSWKAGSAGGGRRMVRLKLEDRKHARSTTFQYVTDGERLLAAFKPIRWSIFDVAKALVIWFAAGALTLISLRLFFPDAAT